MKRTILTAALCFSMLPVTAGAGPAEPAGPAPIPDYPGWSVNYGTIEMRDGGLYHHAPGEGATSYFQAPPVFHGDWRALTTFVIEKRSWGGSYYAEGYGARGDIVISSGDMAASYLLPQDHSGDWTRYEVPLSGPGWTLHGGATSLAEVLARVTRLEIRAEYGAGDDQAQIRGIAFY